ncbi:tetratricopeptide repeat protein [Aquirufa sp. OSTEICH-129V]|uniref:Tetratricopeptide repeat protein n=1 Tax=Aquirufa avitistagni TaxID=3104728 RepID=A0ABW6D936_9BACT
MKKRFSAFGISFLFMFFSAWVSVGQQTTLPTDPAKTFRQANLFFQSKNFIAAREEFIQYLNYLHQQPRESTAEKTQVEYYIAMCSIYTMRPEAEMQAIRFVSEHPESPFAALLKREIGVFYYETGDWVRAIRYLSQAAQTNLEYTYFLAISHYQVKQFKEALALFNNLKYESEEEFSMPAAYYAGVMHFRSGMYDEAIADFKLAAKDPTYGPEIPQWISSALMKQGKIAELEQFVEPILADTTGKYLVTELALILAEKQFANAQYAKAAGNYNILYKASPTKFSRNRTFKFAYALAKSGELDRSLTLFKGIAAEEDSVGQQALQVMADMYQSQNKVKERLETLDAIAALPYHPVLAENAFIARWEIFKSQKDWPRIIQEVKKYQASDTNPVHAELFVDLALFAIQQTQDLSALSHFMLHSPAGKAKFQALYQLMMYEKGAQYYAANDQKRAITFLKRSLEYPLNQEMAWNARYAQAEILARNNKNSDAIKIYMPLLAETSKPTGSPELSQRIRLSLAQSFTYITMYDRAQLYFEEYLSNKVAVTKTPQDFRNAAETAIANRKIEAGLAYFEQAIALGQAGTDALIERKAAVLFNERRYAEANAEYLRIGALYPQSPLRDLATFKAHAALFKSQNKLLYGELIGSLTQTIQQAASGNPYLAPSLLIRGQTYEITNQWSLALDDYIRIVRQFTADSTSKDALIGASEILKRVGRGEEVFELREIYTKQHGDEKGDDEELFDLCRSIFEAGKYRVAVPELVKFISKYPKFEQMAEVNWMLGYGTFQTKDWGNSATYLKRVQPEDKKSEALWLLATLELEQKNTEGAIAYLTASLRETITPELRLKATEKLVSLYAQTDQLAKADVWVDALANPEEKNQLTISLGNAWAQKQDATKAEGYFMQVVQRESSDIGAQALIQVAAMHSQSGDYKGSTDLIKTYFSQEGARYYEVADAWVGKAYLLMADNFIALKNGRQAKVILDSILSSMSDESILLHAKKKLEELSK